MLSGMDNFPYARDWGAGRKIAFKGWLVEEKGPKSVFTLLIGAHFPRGIFFQDFYFLPASEPYFLPYGLWQVSNE